jgi:hypothetical protein
MKMRILSISLLLAGVSSSIAGGFSSKQSKVIELVGRDGSKIATIRVDGQNLMYESQNNTDTFLFSDEKLLTLNNSAKTYRVQSYADLQASASRKAVEIAQSPDSVDTRQGVELKLTEETDAIAGIKVRKLVKTMAGESEAVL